eukprot:15453586-Alexandrium_andersonii.AAC.2
MCLVAPQCAAVLRTPGCPASGAVAVTGPEGAVDDAAARTGMRHLTALRWYKPSSSMSKRCSCRGRWG